MQIPIKRFVPNNYASLLVSLLVLVLVTPFADVTTYGHVGVSLAVLYLTISAALVIATKKVGTKRVLAIAAIGSLLWTCSKSIPFAPFHTIIFQCIANGAILIFLATTAALVLNHILYSEADHNTLCGAICVYLLIGTVFALLYLSCMEIDPTCIRFEQLAPTSSNRHERLSQLIYFSMCTLTTVGFGDITPAARFTRTLCWVEAMSGQLYVAILVARLVGLQIARITLQQGQKTNKIDMNE